MTNVRGTALLSCDRINRLVADWLLFSVVLHTLSGDILEVFAFQVSQYQETNSGISTLSNMVILGTKPDQHKVRQWGVENWVHT